MRSLATARAGTSLSQELHSRIHMGSRDPTSGAPLTVDISRKLELEVEQGPKAR